MDSFATSSFASLRLGLIGVLLGAGSTALAQRPAISPLSANDVSWLFPAPARAADFDKLIAVRDLTTGKPSAAKRDPIWPDAVFKQFLAIAASPAAEAGGKQIGLPAEAQTIDAWFVAGIRIDAGAPGLSNEVVGQFGRSPEIRLIVQPVTRNPDGTPKVLDIAAHLIFNFVAGQNDPAQTGCLQRPKPDLVAFKAIVAELAALRTRLSRGLLGNRVATSGVPLGVHPGLANATTAKNVRKEMKSFLERHISGQRLDAMAIAALPAGAPAPWIFLSMTKVPPGVVPALPNGGFVPVHGPTLDGQQFAQMLEPIGTVPPVVPAPATNNLNPITCRNAALPAGLPVAERSGSSTTELFASPPPAAKAKQVLDLIADPAKSHFFNTDCISCHTETRRAMDLLPLNDIKVVSGIDPAVLPGGDWNVRNFGWSPSGGGQAQATVTRRTAAETAAVVAFINSELAAK